MSWPIAFRVDADSAMGAGHFTRCLSLAVACQAAGANPVFFTAALANGLLNRLRDAGFDLIKIEPDAPDLGVRTLAVWSSAHKRSWVVLDGYHFNGAYQLAVAQAGARLMVIDDFVRLPRYHSEIILDQNLGSESRRYSTSPISRVLLGPKYALLGPGFVEANVSGRTYPQRARRLLVTMGAADAANVTSLVITALSSDDLKDIEVTVVIGGANQRGDGVRKLAERSGFHVLEDVTDMATLMSEADMIITAAGTTSWELCRMGVPGITITVADNQRDIAAALSEHGVGVDLGWYEDVTEESVRVEVMRLAGEPEERARMGQAGMKLVDGRGAGRVMGAMFELSLSQEQT